MAKKLNEGQWQCEFTGCNFTGTKEGYVKNHEKLKHGMHGGSNFNKGGQKAGEKNGKNGGLKCPDCKGKDIRLLNSGVPLEAQAKQQGLKYICDDCQEVW